MLGLLIWQFSLGQDLGEFTAKTDFSIVWNQASERSSILEEHKRARSGNGGGSRNRRKLRAASVTVMVVLFMRIRLSDIT